MTNNIIIIPTYNERENIPIILERIFENVPDSHVLIVDDNSPDKTAEIVESLKSKYKNLDLLNRSGERGLGLAYIDGFKKGFTDNKFRTITMMDGDLSHNPKHLKEMINLSKEYDLVIGSRYIKGGGISDKWKIKRKILSKGANTYLRIIFRYPIKDWTGGFNIINVEKLKEINVNKLDLTGYAFISSLKYHLKRSGASTKESPIFFEERESGESKMSHSIITEAIIAPWRIVFRELFHRHK